MLKGIDNVGIAVTDLNRSIAYLSQVKKPMPRSRQRTKPGRRHFPPQRRPFADDGAAQKMSAVLLEFLEPYRDEALDDTALKNLIALGIVAWNVALLPPGKREAALDDYYAKVFRGSWSARLKAVGRWLKKLIGRRWEAALEGELSEVTQDKRLAYELIQRKLRYYPHNRRFIVNYQLTVSRDEVHLIVESTLPS